MSDTVFSVDQPEDSLGLLLWQTMTVWQRRIKSRLTEYGISHAQFVILAILLWLDSQQQEAIQATLISMSKLDKMTVSAALKKLISLGYVLRREHAIDTRAKQVSLTTVGKRLAKRLVPIVESIDADFFGELSAVERKVMQSVLRKLTDME